jgi:dTDP-4-amino-4,6-dideoxygalactose transaminase
MYTGSLGDFPVSESVAQQGLTLPSFPGLNENDIADICGALEASIEMLEKRSGRSP